MSDLAARIEAVQGGTDPSQVLAAEALDVSCDLWGEMDRQLAGHPEKADVDALFIVGWFYWARYCSADRSRDDADFVAALLAFSHVARAGTAEHWRRIPRDIAAELGPNLELSADGTQSNDYAGPVFAESMRSARRDLLLAAVASFRVVVAMTPQGHWDRGRRLSNLGAALAVLGEQTDELPRLEEAVRCSGFAVTITRADDVQYPGFLLNRANALRARHGRAHRPADLDQAISDLTECFRRTTADPVWLTARSSLLAALAERFAQRDEPSDLDLIIDILSISSASDVQHSEDTVSLATALMARYQRSGRVDDLERSIHAFRAALPPEISAVDAATLVLLAGALDAEASRTRTPDDAAAAVAVHRLAVSHTPSDAPELASRLADLGAALNRQFEIALRPADLAESASSLRKALEVLPEGDSERPRILSNLGNAMGRLFESLGRPEDLDESITLQRQAAALVTLEDPRRASFVLNAAISLRLRYERFRRLLDLDESVELSEEAARASRDDILRYCECLSNVSIARRLRFEAYRSHDDLEAARQAIEQAVEIAPRDHRDLSSYLSNLCNLYQQLFLERQDNCFLDSAVEAGRRAVDASSGDRRHQTALLTNLCLALRRRFGQTGDREDLAHALAIGSRSLECALPDEPGRAGILYNLATVHRAGFAVTRQEWHRGRTLMHCREAAAAPTASPTIRLTAASSWGEWSMLDGDPSVAVDGYSEGVPLLSLVAWHGLDRATQERQLAATAGLPRDAAASAAEVGSAGTAVEFLEHGRSVLWSHLLNMREDLDALTAVAPAWAARLDELRKQLDSPHEAGQIDSFVLESY